MNYLKEGTKNSALFVKNGYFNEDKGMIQYIDNTPLAEIIKMLS